MVREASSVERPEGGRQNFTRQSRSSALGARRLAWIRLIVVASLLGSWELSARMLGTDRWTSSPTALTEELRRWHTNGDLWIAVWTTAVETIGGFILGSLAGAIVGFVLGSWPRLGRMFEPMILLLYAAPKVAFAPLFILWFGIGIGAKALFSALLVFFLVFFTTFQGVRQVDRELLTFSRVLGAGTRDVWLKIAIPHAALWVFAGLRLALPYALIGAVVGEFLAARTGLGFLIRTAAANFNTAGVYAGITVLVAFATALLALMQMIERYVLRWQTTPSLDGLG